MLEVNGRVLSIEHCDKGEEFVSLCGYIPFNELQIAKKMIKEQLNQTEGAAR